MPSAALDPRQETGSILTGKETNMDLFLSVSLKAFTSVMKSVVILWSVTRYLRVQARPSGCRSFDASGRV
jgi:hypothetical protein